MNRTLLSIMMICTAGFLSAQIQFQKQETWLNVDSFNSGIPVAVMDYNGDGWDDIVRMDDASAISIELQTTGKDPFYNLKKLTAGVNPQWNIVVGDLDNNGNNEIMTAGQFDEVKIFSATPFTSNFTVEEIPTTKFFAQGANFVDINNDGWLDAFVCDDNEVNRILLNDSTGHLRPTENYDLTTDPVSDNSGNYGSIWTDLDSDGDLDCYVAKCRQGVEDPTDPRRINMLFLNNGENQFTEHADSFGLAVGLQSWSGDFNDYDNDGDLDCFITNHDGPSQLFENIDNVKFVDVTDSSGINVGSSIPVQGVFRDFDNDGYLDLIVTGSSHFIFRNNGDGTFSWIPEAIEGMSVSSFGIGDLNHDGFLDIYASYPQLFNIPSDDDDAVFLNTPNSNHFCMVQLEGNASNRSGVGARLELYGGWGMQIREVRAGESYGITNSLTQHFGIGEFISIDSLIVRWPSGTVDKFTALGVDRQFFVEEGGCLTSGIAIGGPHVLCGDDTVKIEAPSGFFTYEWSNGSTLKDIDVTEEGVYFVRMIDEIGCLVKSLPVAVFRNVDPDSVEITLTGDPVSCSGDSLTITAPDYGGYKWSTGDSTQSISVTDGGSYSVVVQGACDLIPSQTIAIEFIQAGNFETEGDTILPGETATLNVSGGENLSWYDSDTSTSSIAEGPVYMTSILDSSKVYFVENVITIPGDEFNTGMPAHAGGTKYNADQFNGSLIFDVHRTFHLDSVTVYTDFAGERTIRIRNDNDATLFESTLMLDSGKTVIPILTWLDPDESYQITTDQEKNLETFGVNNPKLWRSEDGVNYPYEIENVVSINESNFGFDFYYYFYDWKISLEDRDCVSERKEVLAYVDDQTATHEPAFARDLKIYPNPASDILNIKVPEDDYQIELMTQSGKSMYTIRTEVSEEFRISISDIPAGIYFVKISSESGIVLRKVVIVTSRER